ncbi:aminoglycoside phosphotransferase family protein [Candidatus Woesearchaeota archaeon]|nr:aminoglycoside phosphotransferase family protein [Candidatus Woesearchaeota archaeon]
MEEQIKSFLIKKNFSFLPKHFDVKLIGNGAYNTNFLIDGEKRFVFRVNTHTDQVAGKGLDNEHTILTSLPKGIAPKSFYVDVSKMEFPFPFRIEEFKEGSCPTHFSKKLLGTLAKTLALLHQKKFRLSGTFPGNTEGFRFENFMRPFLEQLKGKDKNIDKIIEKAKLFVKYYDKQNPLTSFSLIHFDIHLHNMLYDQKNLTLVDWEYAEIGDSAIDIATVFWYSPMFDYSPIFSEKERVFFLERYIEASENPEIVSRLKIAEPIIVLIQTLWLKAQLDNIDQIPSHIRTEDRIQRYRKGFEIGLNFLRKHDFSF